MLKQHAQRICFVFLILITGPVSAQFIASDDTSMCSGSALLQVFSKPDPFYTVESIPFTTETHAGSNAFPSGMDDISTAAISLGFSFRFFCNTYTQCYISTNGWISFTHPPTSWNTVYGPGGSPTYSLPNSAAAVPKNAIMGPWQDWYPNFVGSVCKYQTLGSAPYRRFVVSFQDIQLFDCYAAAKGSFQIVLYETTNIIENHIIYKDNCTSWESGKATQAIHNSTGTLSVEVPGRDASVWTADNESWAYIPSVVEWYDGALLIGSGDSISVSPLVPTTYTATYQGCDGLMYTEDVAVDIDPNDPAFSYPAGFPGFCATGSVLPSSIETPGGTFSASPSDLVIDPATGEIDLDSGIPGTDYTIMYLLPPGPCQDSSEEVISILNWDDSSFTYSASAYCPEGTTSPTDIATPGGTFSVSPAGLVVNPSTGTINLSTGTVGTTYTITYVTGGDCPTSSSFDITIDPLDDASFSYDASSYCPSGSSAPTVTTPGGSFTITPSSMDIDPSTGELDLSTGISGTTYTITYTTPFPCVASTTVTILIDPLDDASFSYDASSYCPSGTTEPVFITIPGGSFTVLPAGLTIDPLTGALDLSTGTIGTVYAITYTTPPGPCQNSGTETILIDPLDDPAFNYAASGFCANSGSVIPVSVTTPGGSYTITPADAVINASTGALDLSTGTPGTTYTVTYTTPTGPCQNVSTQTVTIEPITTADFSYTPAIYCNTGSAIPGIIFPGGIFSAQPGIVINTASGEVDLAASAPGTDYAIYYTSPGCGETDTFYITINPLPDLSLEVDTIVCLEAGALSIFVDPEGGTLSGTGVSGYGFDPALAGEEGLYPISYTYTDTNACTSTISVPVHVIENTVNAGPDVSIYEAGQITLHASGGSTFIWSPDSGLSCTGCPSPIASPFDTIIYIVTSYDEYGCVGSDDIVVNVIPVFDSTVFVPNTFTPNGDGLNDLLFAFGSDIAVIRYFAVFDRWGELLWRRENLMPGDIHEGWNGTSKGVQVSNGVYAFVIDVELNNGADLLRRGNVTVLR